MIRFAFSLCLALAMAAAAVACPCKGNADPCDCGPSCDCEKPGQTYGVIVTEEQVVVLPQDASKLYLTIVGDPNSARYREITGWFNTSKDLQAIKNQTHFTALPTTSTLFKDRYARSTGATPRVLLQAPNGVVIWEAAGDNLPMSAEALTKGINTECLRRWKKRHCPDGNCPRPTPPPQTDPAPQPIDPPAPEAKPEPEGPHAWIVAALVAAGLAVGGGAGLGKKIKEISNGKGSK